MPGGNRLLRAKLVVGVVTARHCTWRKRAFYRQFHQNRPSCGANAEPDISGEAFQTQHAGIAVHAFEPNAA